MNYLTLDDVKKHLNVDFDEDDSYITSLIKAAEAATATYLQAPLKEYEGSDGMLPSDIVHAMRLMIGNWYASREPVAFASATKVPYTIDFLLLPHKRYGTDVK